MDILKYNSSSVIKKIKITCSIFFYFTNCNSDIFLFLYTEDGCNATEQGLSWTTSNWGRATWTPLRRLSLVISIPSRRFGDLPVSERDILNTFLLQKSTSKIHPALFAVSYNFSHFRNWKFQLYRVCFTQKRVSRGIVKRNRLRFALTSYLTCRTLNDLTLLYLS